ncbi:MAG TPA: RES domain-containing protein [Solirubrobacterales bacterium]
MRIVSPAAGVWRVGRTPDPIEFPDPPRADELDYPRAGNRFDSPTENFRVCYFATDLNACFGETLSRFRSDPALIAAADEEGFMPAGSVPADWRNQRIAVQVKFVPNELLPELRFLDIEALKTRRELRSELASLLAYYGYEDLDVPTVRGADRRITRWIAKWAFEQRDADGAPVFAGIRYLSRLNTEWECWAVFHDVEIKEITREPIERESEALKTIARHFDLTVF